MGMANVIRQISSFFNQGGTATFTTGTIAYSATNNKFTTAGSLALDLSGGTVTLGTVTGGTITPTSIIRTGQVRQVGTRAKVGTTAGWVVGAANNLGTIATIPAGVTAGTLVVPIDGLKVGDTITAFKVNGCVNSAGNTVTVDAEMRKLTPAAAAGGTDATVGSITQVSKTAAYLLADSKTGLSSVVATGVTYYLLITVTTAASTTVELEACEITVTEA